MGGAAPGDSTGRREAVWRGGPAGRGRRRVTLSGGEWSATQQAAASWRRHDPLLPTAHGSFQSYESVAHGGWWITTEGVDEMTVDHPSERAVLGTVRPLILGRRPTGGKEVQKAHGLLSSFEEARGEAEYPAAAWWLRPDKGVSGRGRGAGGAAQQAASALLYPLNEVVDESFSVYWDLPA